MSYYRSSYSKKGKGRGAKLSATASAVIVLVFIILYILDSQFGFGNKQVEGECEFHFIDVGQGDATMIISSDSTVVIDTGTGDHADSFAQYVKSYTDNVDYLILTHPHEDHIGGADELLELVHVDNVIMSDAYSETYTFTKILDAIEAADIPVIEAKAGDKYAAGEIEFTILAPLSEFTDYNDYSIVTKVEFGSSSVIVTGDVEHHSEKLMVERYGPSGLKADILQMGHHGSATSNHESFMECIAPEYAVISCGKDNEYGHPHRETLQKLRDFDITYYRTDKVGSIVFRTDGKNLSYVEAAQ